MLAAVDFLKGVDVGGLVSGVEMGIGMEVGEDERKGVGGGRGLDWETTKGWGWEDGRGRGRRRRKREEFIRYHGALHRQSHGPCLYA